MFFDPNEESENNASLENLENLASAAHLAHLYQNNNKSQPSTEENANTAPSNIPAIIYKCNNCDFFGQLKQEVEAHIDTVHPNSDSSDVISIPTNPMAIQAFQAAMAAATLAAVSRASKTSETPSPAASPSSIHAKVNESNPDNDDDLCPVAVKRERLDIGEGDNSPEEPTIIVNEGHVPIEVVEQQETTAQAKKSVGVQCPLCQDFFIEKTVLETHLMTVHSVNKDGLARLLLLVDTSMWQCEKSTLANRPQPAVSEASSSAKAISDTTITSTKPPLTGYELSMCQQCGSSFKHEQQLLQHAQKMQHYTMQKGEYLCLAFNSVRNPCKMHFPSLTAMFNHYNDTHMRLVISERHVYKYRCKQCSLAFKTQEKLATHTLYHTMRDATKCGMCQRNFRSTQALQKHMEQTHSQTATTSGSGNNMECASPRTISPSGSETGRPMPETSRTATASDKFESESNRSVTPGQDICAPTQSPSSTQNEQQSSPSPSTQQQQQMSTISALINQQQQNAAPSDLLHHLQMQHQQFQNLPALHNLQQMQQQFPQFAAAVAASGMPINPVEMLNLMQFHHLISLNFMNLAPPLIFGGNAAAASSVAGSNSTTPTNIPNSNVSQPPTHIAPSTDLIAASSSTSTTNITPASVSALPNVDVNAQILQQQQQQISPGASNSQLLNNQKRARTRITDDQLKILRAHFDINNSPSEESILEMSQKANLPMKVVKHWFRNTLFKERQRNKDSPYNFNNPPSTTLNLEEYERTGQAKVMPVTEQVQHHQLQIPSRPSSAHSISNTSEYSNQQQQQQMEHKQREEAESLRSQASSAGSSAFPLDVQIKTEPGEDLTTLPTSLTVESSTATAMTFLKQQQQQKLRFHSLDQQEHDLMMMSEHHLSSAAQQQHHAAAVVAAASFYNSYETKSESESSDIHSRPHTPNSNTTSNLYASMNDLLSQQLENMPLNQMGPPKKFQLNPNANPCSNISSTPNDRNMTVGGTSSGSSVLGSTGSGGITVSSKLFEKHSPSAQYDNNSNSSNSSTTSSGKRANRTRFTDYQIKVLQEFFENNSYPKDSDLEYLSKLLLLSPRVIVVWFQNARQKQRKIYENQPNNSLYESEEKKQNINYACKKCSLVFQRYYELIRHQKNHCFKEENNKKSAKAQIAAAQIAQNLSSEDSNSSMDINSAAAAAILAQHHPVVGVATAAVGLGKTTPSTREFSPIPSNATTPPRNQGNSDSSEHQKFFCDKCKLTFTHFDHLREHQLMHLVNPNLHLPSEAHTTSSAAAAVAAYGPFGSILQSLQQAAHLQQAVAANSATGQPAAKKRKYSETSSNADDVSSVGGFSLTGADYDSHAKKYNFLYQYFLQNEGNSDLRQQFHNQDSAELNMEFLANYYQQTELKKRTNYEFLFQYYVRNEQQTNVSFDLADNKPNIEFLLQYYQLCESKKFFQLEASPQRIHDAPLMQGGIDTAQHNTNASSNSNNSSRPASDGSDRSSSSPGGSGVNEESNGGGVVNNIENEQQHSPLMATYNTEYKTRSNGQHCNNKNNSNSSANNNNNSNLLTNIEVNNHNFCQNSARSERLNSTNKLEEQMDQLDGLQEVKNQTFSNYAGCSSAAIAAQESPIRTTSANTSVLGSYYQNLEDFLDATMIENQNQTLIFNTETHNMPEPKKTSDASSISIPTHLEEAANHIPESSNQKQANKRLRTTILPEQLNFLYECYQNESNPSRKMLEEIAKKVNLKKRVVQVWFQNTRAKDKKSRNQQRQHFSNISDDNSNSSSITNNNIKALANLAPTTTAGSKASNDIIRDCNLCQVTQVNIQQHAFTVEHIHKVKELLAQTTAAAAASLLQEGDAEGEEKSLYDYRDQQARLNGDQAQNVHQQHQQLALMMMAFQTQNMPKSMIAFNMGDDNSAGDCNTADDGLEKKLSSKYLTVKDQKKSKRNLTKKKKATTKKTMVESFTNDSENFSNFNATHLDTCASHHYNTSHGENLTNNFKRDKFSLDTNEQNYGYNNNNNDHTAATKINDDDDQVNEVKSKNCRNTIKNNCESINDNNDIVKSQIYNYNNTITENSK